jgi:hypothetical protein
MSATPPTQAGTLLSADHRESGSRTTSTTVNPSILMTNTLPVIITAAVVSGDDQSDDFGQR